MKVEIIKNIIKEYKYGQIVNEIIFRKGQIIDISNSDGRGNFRTNNGYLLHYNWFKIKKES